MTTNKRRLILILNLVLMNSGFIFCRSLYINPRDGDDNNDGLTQLTARKSFASIKNLLIPGDSILFEGGIVYEQNLEFNNFGSDDAPLVITSYGSGMAIINAGNSYGLYLKNCRNIIVENLLFKGSGRLSGNSNNGIIIEDCQNIYVNEIDISGFQHSGILVQGSGKNISITRVNSHDNGFAGIHVFGKWPDKYQCKNIYIGHCKAENNPGDPTVTDNHSGNGILVGACDSVLIEYCEALENGWDMPRKGNGPVGIWAWHADHVIIQHCISHNNKTSEGAADGGGFDFDGGVTNSIIQYCLSYENEGVGYLVCQFPSASPLRNNTLRYNISINDGIKNWNCSLLFWNALISETLSDISIYNNVFFNYRSNGSAVRYTSQYIDNILFANNIFLTRGPAISGQPVNSEFLGNVYWNFGESFYLLGYYSLQKWATTTGYEMLGDSMVGMNMDPLLTDPGAVTLTNPDSINMKTLSGFLLSAESPVINRGIDISSLFGIDPGVSDLFGNEIPAGSGFDPGVHEYQDTVSTGTSVKTISGKGLSDSAHDWVRLYPNPSENGDIYLHINKLPVLKDINVLITDINGKIMHMEQVPVKDDTCLVLKRPSTLNAGRVYFLTVSAGNNRKTFKFISW
jgi:hypothetical protein